MVLLGDWLVTAGHIAFDIVWHLLGFSCQLGLTHFDAVLTHVCLLIGYVASDVTASIMTSLFVVCHQGPDAAWYAS